MTRALPVGWPRAVPPPGVGGWERAATGWLLDRCPPEYRGEAVLRRHPVVLARFTAWQVAASLDGTRQALAQVRASLRGAVPAATVEEAVAVLEREAARLEVLVREVTAVEHALRARPRTVPGTANA